MPSWAPGVYKPATADPSAVKSAFLFDKRSRCDPISVLQMPRFPVTLFPFCFFLLFLPLTHSLSLALAPPFILSFYLSFLACLDNCMKRSTRCSSSASSITLLSYWGLSCTSRQTHIDSHAIGTGSSASSSASSHVRLRGTITPPSTPHLNGSSCAQSAHGSVQINANTSYIHCIFIIYCKPL